MDEAWYRGENSGTRERRLLPENNWRQIIAQIAR
jgi:hypothetical protein